MRNLRAGACLAAQLLLGVEPLAKHLVVLEVRRLHVRLHLQLVLGDELVDLRAPGALEPLYSCVELVDALLEVSLLRGRDASS